MAAANWGWFQDNYWLDSWFLEGWWPDYGTAAPASGIVTVDIDEKVPGVDFDEKAPGVGFTSKTASVGFSGKGS